MYERAETAERAAENGRNKDLYNTMKLIVGERKRQAVGVESKDGVLKSDSQERLQRWEEHFSEVLNREEPAHSVENANLNGIDEIEEIDKAWQVQEVKNALKRTRNGKAAGVDEVGPDP